MGHKILMPVKFGHCPHPDVITSIKNQTLIMDDPIMVSIGDQFITKYSCYEIFRILHINILSFQNEDIVFMADIDYKILHADSFEKMATRLRPDDSLSALCMQKHPAINCIEGHYDMGVHCIKTSAMPKLEPYINGLKPQSGCICKNWASSIPGKIEYFLPGTVTIERVEPIKWY